jgi:hypothetical protein
MNKLNYDTNILLYCYTDEAVGTITRHARQVLGDDVVVVVSSDNGGSVWEGGLNFPLRSGKFSSFEGTTTTTTTTTTTIIITTELTSLYAAPP